MNPLSSELLFYVHNCLIISLKDFCIVIRKWPTFLLSTANLSISGVLIKVLTLQANHIQYYAAVNHRSCSLEFVTHVAFLQHDYALYAL